MRLGQTKDDLRGPWYVYRLIDPRTDKAFYVGQSVNPQKRLLGHSTDWASSAKSRIIAIKKAGHKPKLEIVSTHKTREEALVAEFLLIEGAVGLVNLKKATSARQPRIPAYLVDGRANASI